MGESKYHRSTTYDNGHCECYCYLREGRTPLTLGILCDDTRNDMNDCANQIRCEKQMVIIMILQADSNISNGNEHNDFFTIWPMTKIATQTRFKTD